MTLGALVLTALQLHWATVAYQIGAPYGEGRTLVAVSGQESSYCEFKHNHWSVGCLGIKRSTARFIADSAATRTRLEDDNDYNFRTGLKILLYCKDHTNNWRRMVACFHWGLPHESQMSDAQIDADGYVKAIQRRMKEIRVSND